jgi:hypothetical protein
LLVDYLHGQPYGSPTSNPAPLFKIAQILDRHIQNLCNLGDRLTNRSSVLVQARNLGNTEAEILANYPTINATDLTNSWAYAAVHPIEITQAIQENQDA